MHPSPQLRTWSKLDAPIESYDELDKLAKAFAAKVYSGSVPGNYNTKKCIDLYWSPELSATLKKVPAHWGDWASWHGRRTDVVGILTARQSCTAQALG